MGLTGAEKRGGRAETSGETGAETRGETGVETGGRGADEEDPMLDEADGKEAIFRITAIKNRFS